MERVMGFEPTTSCLGSKNSTAELRPPLDIKCSQVSYLMSLSCLGHQGQATDIQCNAHSSRCGSCVLNVKLGLSNKVIQSLGGWETPDMVSHYAASLTFDDALVLYRVVNQIEPRGWHIYYLLII